MDEKKEGLKKRRECEGSGIMESECWDGRKIQG